MGRDAIVYTGSEKSTDLRSSRFCLAPTALDETACPLVRLIRQLERCGRPLSLCELVRSAARIELTRWDLHRFVRFADKAYQDQPIHACDHFEIRCLCWQSGQRSSIHDHRGSRCCVRVVEGVLTNRDFERRSDGRLHLVRRCEVPAGDLLARQDKEIHQVANEQPPGHNLVTLHVYSPPLTSERTVYGING